MVGRGIQSVCHLWYCSSLKKKEKKSQTSSHFKKQLTYFLHSFSGCKREAKVTSTRPARLSPRMSLQNILLNVDLLELGTVMGQIWPVKLFIRPTEFEELY